MTETQASELISQNMTAIYGYAFARLYDKDKVEDLSSEIICEILSSVKNLKDDTAFWGFVWKIAENTFRKFIKKEEQIQQHREPDSDNLISICETSVENEYIEREEKNTNLYLLRRELSLLSKMHREVCVAYYVDNKSCSQIAKEKNISVEMVKYHLFKTRKLLKEGISMTRVLGEKSYNPGTFRLDFWGDYNKYEDLFKRKLPGAIALSAYHIPMTAEEISVELGVSMPYLEEEIEILETAGVLTKTGHKYQTNLVIITDDFEKEFIKKTRDIYSKVANSIFKNANQLIAKIRKLDFYGNDYDDNRLLFAILNIAMVNGYMLAQDKSPMGTPNKLTLGGSGWIFGYDNDYNNHHFYGVTIKTPNKTNTAWFSAVNYRVISECQIYDHSGFSEKAEVMCDAILGNKANIENNTSELLIENGFIGSKEDKLSAKFPVFPDKVYTDLCEIINPITEIICDCMIEISNQAETILKDHVPASVKNQCRDIAKIRFRLDVAAFLLETLISEKKLILPSSKTPLCVWGVRI
ncbi:MAG: sigma-70 family RNA polymerase sigma factor [Clostridia bacterium]|nr:sigma-70 family RNA polymerase sigma factor [Clostridia bacterium]